MKKRSIPVKMLRGLVVVTIMILIVGLSSPPVMAVKPVSQRGSDQPLAVTDDAVLEVGVEWVNDYPGTGSDLSATDDDAVGLYNRLRGCGFIGRYNYGNGNAWEEDFKGYAKPGGGTEPWYTDSVDMAYFSGHGNTGYFVFGVNGNLHDDPYLTYSDCRMEWGNDDMEWIGLSTCLALNNEHLVDWAWCMNRAHLVLGFTTVMADTAHGDWFGRYICEGKTITQAWFMAADRSQPAGRVARVMAEDTCQLYYDRKGYVCPDTYDNWFYTLDHKVGCEPARSVDIEALNGQMPVFTTPYLSLAQANAEWQHLGTAFGLPTTGSYVDTAMGGEVWISPDGQLEMDPNSGMYGYTNMNEMWQEPQTGQTGSPSAILSPDDAHQIADQFLISNNMMPSDAQYHGVYSDTVSNYETTSPGQANAYEQTTPAVYQVVYSRILTYTVPSASPDLPGTEVEFSVVGPGAKLKVYVDPTAGPSIGSTSPVIGGVGGWRNVTSAAPGATQTMIDIITEPQALLLFNNLEANVSLSYTPVTALSRQVQSVTLAYYEHPLGTGQDMLIPVYNLEVDYTLEGGLTQHAAIYIPANPQFSAPYAKINPVGTVPPVLAVGDTLHLLAADASKNLSALGFDASLTFPLGTGDTDSYLYNWYLDEVTPANLIGTGMALNWLVPLLPVTHEYGMPQNHSIILEVIDSLSPRPPSTMTASFPVTIAGPLFLPLVEK